MSEEDSEYELTENVIKTIEETRVFWSKVAKSNGWYVEPFYVQVWVDFQNNLVTDSVSFKGMESDIVCPVDPDEDDIYDY
jgi:hypothetical protein